MSAFRWTNRSETAALLVAQDDLTDGQIAAKARISDRQLRRWKLEPAFSARVEEHRTAWRAAVKARGIADKQNRIDALNDRHRRMQQVIEERAEAYEYQRVPGGRTGLIVHDVKGVGRGEDFQLIDVYSVDTGLLKEMREHEKQAAQELGQWTEKRTITLDIKREAEAIARELGIPVEQVLRESGVEIES